jgi:hypothetical protein
VTATAFAGRASVSTATVGATALDDEEKRGRAARSRSDCRRSRSAVIRRRPQALRADRTRFAYEFVTEQRVPDGDPFRIARSARTAPLRLRPTGSTALRSPGARPTRTSLGGALRAATQQP